MAPPAQACPETPEEHVHVTNELFATPKQVFIAAARGQNIWILRKLKKNKQNPLIQAKNPHPPSAATAIILKQAGEGPEGSARLGASCLLAPAPRTRSHARNQAPVPRDPPAQSPAAPPSPDKRPRPAAAPRRDGGQLPGLRSASAAPPAGPLQRGPRPRVTQPCPRSQLLAPAPRPGPGPAAAALSVPAAAALCSPLRSHPHRGAARGNRDLGSGPGRPWRRRLPRCPHLDSRPMAAAAAARSLR